MHVTPCTIIVSSPGPLAFYGIELHASLSVVTAAPPCGVFPPLQGAPDTGSEPEVVMGSKVSSKMAAPTARVIQVTSLLSVLIAVGVDVLRSDELC